MSLGTRKLIAALALIGLGLVAFDVLTGSEWTAFVLRMLEAFATPQAMPR